MNVVTPFCNTYGSILANLPNEVLSMHAGEPGVRINELRKWRQALKLWEGHTWWLVPTGKRLVGPLRIVVNREGFRDLLSLLKRVWAMNLYALLIVGTMVAFDKGVFIRSMRWAHVRGNP